MTSPGLFIPSRHDCRAAAANTPVFRAEYLLADGQHKATGGLDQEYRGLSAWRKGGDHRADARGG